MANSPLQKSPRGVLGALDLKTLGQAPTLFGDTLTPVLESVDFYLSEQLEILQKDLVVTNPATAFADTFDVPQGEYWRIIALGLSGTLAAADAALTVLGIFQINDGARQVTLNSAALTSTAAADRMRALGHSPSSRILMRPGWGMLGGVSFSAAPAVAATIAFSMLFQRIRE